MRKIHLTGRKKTPRFPVGRVLAWLDRKNVDIVNVESPKTFFPVFHIEDLQGSALIALLGNKNCFDSNSHKKLFLAVLANIGKELMSEGFKLGDSIGMGSSSNLHAQILLSPVNFHKIFLHKKR